jgi:hypothetical protein
MVPPRNLEDQNMAQKVVDFGDGVRAWISYDTASAEAARADAAKAARTGARPPLTVIIHPAPLEDDDRD